MTAYYNEIDEDCVACLKELIHEGVIAPGEVDGRSIKDVQQSDIKGFKQCHFFAGLGVWSYAARQAGFPDSRELFTGSCPCTPFSIAGRGKSFDDPRDLWPDLYRLIRGARPAVILGELTAQKLGRIWFDRTCSDLAHEDYACRAVDVPACSVDGPHERSRIYWLAVEHAAGERRGEGRTQSELGRGGSTATGSDASRALGHAHGEILAKRESVGRNARAECQTSERTNDSPVKSFWHEHEWITCHDGKARRTQPRSRLLVAGFAARIPMWKMAGNAICAPLAIEVIKAFLESENG